MNIKPITCGFCDGTGKDPFGLLSAASACQVCIGRRAVMLAEPVITCVFCQGSGVYPCQRLTCTVCGGKGSVTALSVRTAKCPDCRGTGATPDSGLPCLTCKGRGLVAT